MHPKMLPTSIRNTTPSPSVVLLALQWESKASAFSSLTSVHTYHIIVLSFSLNTLKDGDFKQRDTHSFIFPHRNAASLNHRFQTIIFNYWERKCFSWHWQQNLPTHFCILQDDTACTTATSQDPLWSSSSYMPFSGVNEQSQDRPSILWVLRG